MSSIQQPPVNGAPAPAPKAPVPAKQPSGPVPEAFVRQFLGDVQGNILKGHGRPYVKCLFFTFVNGNAKEAAGPVVRGWIRRLADGVITSAPRQLEETELYHNYGIPGGLFGTFFLSSAGYRYLDADLPVPPPFTGAADPDEDAFAEGMKARQDLLNDPAKGKWETYFQSDVHAMLLLADVDPARLNEAAARAILDVKAVTQALHVEHGHVLNNEHGDGIEHFGYADG
ncbi:MAG: hypothetical protein ICV83_15080 [Cytophagales bacterium]|nr:hypothetical protein [Cytophagales bacterium]